MSLGAMFLGAILLLSLTSISANAEANLASPQAATKGAQLIIVVLVEFSDLRHVAGNQVIRDRLKELDDYYREASYGQAWVVYEMTDRWYQTATPVNQLDIQKWDYNGQDMQKFRREAVSSADKDVNYQNYDYVFVLAAGRVWPNAGASLSVNTNDGLSRLSIAVVNEQSEGGTCAHELGHMIPSYFASWRYVGLPDLYSYEAAERGEPSSIFVGPWDIMDINRPARHFSSFSKIMLGWITYELAKPTATEVLLFVIEPITKESGTRAVKILTKSQTYYLVETRRKIGFDRSLPDEGVIISYVDETKRSGYGIVRVADKNPLTKTLNDAAFHVGDKFEDPDNSIYIIIAMTDGSSFTVAISGSGILSLKDTDGDGLFDYIEEKLGTNPKNPDTDSDGLSDGDEVNKYKTNPLKADTDGDGLSDGEEIKKHGTNPLEPDTDGDGLSDGKEVNIGSNPLKTDTDGDGLTDGEEVNKYKTNPLKADTDGDGLNDKEELLKGTNPLKADTDDDFWNDRIDPAPTNPLLPNILLIAAIAIIILAIVMLRRRRSSQAILPVSASYLPTAAGIETVSVKYCHECGREMMLEASYCPKCGTRQDSYSE